VVIFRKHVAGLNERALHRFVARACRTVGLRGEVNVLLTSNAQMKSLNRRFRGKDKATDVLSFPGPPESRKEFAGDIAISAEIAAQNARALRHSPAEEVKILALHGILHLRGYDHESDHGQMEKKEQRLRRQLRLPLGLIARAVAAKEAKELRAAEEPRAARPRPRKAAALRRSAPRLRRPA